ncbi:hypothetical protein [Brunnivagina elsteri]|uniref:Uncharacterized protein n=1 Tax=Brunnivagina elsteri CCALA 953 TaxID=987040 RepID=A0A2A2TQT9_9CYAN|nr:hypothetical protein [Calothrix elsteri]PAX60508.1 hypothetical protein CK510_01475 [Calothrix elsteri CCALA 953]
MTLIKKSEQLLLLKIKKIEEDENIQPETKDIPEEIALDKQVILENREANYIPVRDNPIVQSVGKSGWQISDIWRDIRVDNFSD